MELKDVKTILARIKSNYPTFVNDDYTRSEWYKELKDYSLEDVMDKLEQHFRSEQYGNSIPKVYFLTKYLTKEKDKKTNKADNLMVFCQICGKKIPLSTYQEHYGRCLDVGYLQTQLQKYANKDINIEAFREMDEETFKEKYDKVAKYVYDNTDNDEEREYIGRYLELVND